MSIAKNIAIRLGRVLVVALVVTFITSLLMDQIPGGLENLVIPLATEPSVQPAEEELVRQDIGNRQECKDETAAIVKRDKLTVDVTTADPATGQETVEKVPVNLVESRGVLASDADIDVNAFCSIVEAKVGVREDLNLNDPVPVRWAKWVGKASTGDFGNWYLGVNNKAPVIDDVKERILNSILLILYTQLIALGVAIPLAVYSAYKKDGWLDRLASTSSFAALAIPSFAIGLTLAYFLGVRLRILPPSGYAPISEDPIRHIRTMVIPSLALGLGIGAVYFRALRTDMIATLQQDFVTMARAKGLKPGRILLRHALRPSSLTLLTLVGLNIGTLIGGAVIVEVLFGIPGLGTLVAKAIAGRQAAALQTLVALLAIIFVVVNQAVDLIYSLLDPRIRHGK